MQAKLTARQCGITAATCGEINSLNPHYSLNQSEVASSTLAAGVFMVCPLS